MLRRVFIVECGIARFLCAMRIGRCGRLSQPSSL